MLYWNLFLLIIGMQFIFSFLDCLPSTSFCWTKRKQNEILFFRWCLFLHFFSFFSEIQRLSTHDIMDILHVHGSPSNIAWCTQVVECLFRLTGVGYAVNSVITNGRVSHVSIFVLATHVVKEEWGKENLCIARTWETNWLNVHFTILKVPVWC